MGPADILEKVRSSIKEYAKGDSDKWFYANRYIFARLNLDERKTKTKIKQELLSSEPVCRFCHKSFDSAKGVNLHRLDDNRAYSKDNCALMHPDCHQQYHAQNPTNKKTGRLRHLAQKSVDAVLIKESKRYSNSFLYWWDISSLLAEDLKRYDAIEFLKKDSGESCVIPTATLKEFFIKRRQTSRGKGNYGIKVLKNQPNELAFEPGVLDRKWLFLPVVWMGKEED